MYLQSGISLPAMWRCGSIHPNSTTIESEASNVPIQLNPEHPKITTFQKEEKRVSRQEEEENAQMCPCGKAKESRTHVVGECEICKEERDVLKEMRKIDECDMQKLRTLDNSQKTIAYPRR